MSRQPSTLNVMVAFRSRRIESLLGARLDEDLKPEHVRALVSDQVSEAFDLDFKRELYGHLDRDKRALATDVAALANTVGGVLILGIDEDDQARAVSAPGVSVSDDECRRILQVVASLVVPMPVFDVLPVGDPATPGHGFLVVAVTRSPLAPHAVIVNDGFRYPRRNGATTRYLSEPEVATAYRERFADARRQIDRAEQIEQEALHWLVDDGNRCWIVVSLVPDLPGELLIDQEALRTVQRELLNTRPMVIPTELYWLHAAVGRRRLVLDDARNDNETAHWLRAELHHDGAGVFAVNTSDVARTARLGSPSPQGELWVNDEQVVNGILTGLRFLSRHALERAAAGGNALVRAQVYPADRGAVYLNNAGRGISDLYSGQRLSVPTPPAESVAPLDSLAADGPDLVAAAYLLATELFQAFGRSEAAQLTRDGQLRLPYWNVGRHEYIQAWATQAGVTVTTETLPV